ncbi:MAG: GIY-YIG nuclease family protein [Candidatus Omnitrophica bacterium]|nr:GIY-YIG nuclease family protein [Candidatus Omnitrophota bacterium]MDD5352023.1 GIY-YIG nuclease family protein [Candidatus Omnitrophota bacterium]MDD5551077.1 GIY-YIG nuclease family protein [Candidatus Omnitrophota bacterium]
MYYVYILQSEKDGSLYVGSTKNLIERLRIHNAGHNRSTKSRIPWKLIECEDYSNFSLALKREKFLKTGDGRRVLKNLLKFN